MDIKDLLKKDEKSYVSRQDFSLKTAVQRLVCNDMYVMQKEQNFAQITPEQKKEI